MWSVERCVSWQWRGRPVWLGGKWEWGSLWSRCQQGSFNIQNRTWIDHMIFFVALVMSVSSCYLNRQVILSKISSLLRRGRNYFLRHQDFHQHLVSEKAICQNLLSGINRPLVRWSCPRPLAFLACRWAWSAPRERRCAEAERGIDYKRNVWWRGESIREGWEPCGGNAFLQGHYHQWY